MTPVCKGPHTISARKILEKRSNSWTPWDRQYNHKNQFLSQDSKLFSWDSYSVQWLWRSVRLPPERRQEIVTICTNILFKHRVTIRKFSQLIGKLVATHHGVEYAPLFYKPLEKVKEQEFKKQKGNYNSFMTIPKHVKTVIKWWIQNVESSYKQISHLRRDGDHTVKQKH